MTSLDLINRTEGPAQTEETEGETEGERGDLRGD